MMLNFYNSKRFSQNVIIGELNVSKYGFNVMLLISFFINYGYSNAQIIDRYGINFGTSFSTQIWKNSFFPNEDNKSYKFGPMAFAAAEKDISEKFIVRSELGYIQKGFKNMQELRWGDGTTGGVLYKNLILHDIALGLGLKIQAFKSNFAPYMVIGIRGDYMFSYKDIMVNEEASGLQFNMFKSQVEKFNKLNLGGLFGMGIQFNEKFGFELECNPSFTHSYKDNWSSIKDLCWGAKFGINISEFVE